MPAEVLPAIGGDDEPLVEEGDATGLLGGGGVPLLGGLGNQQASLLAQACVDKGQAKATFGTGTFVLGNCGGSVPARREGLLATAAARAGGEPRSALEGVAHATCDVLDVVAPAGAPVAELGVDGGAAGRRPSSAPSAGRPSRPSRWRRAPRGPEGRRPPSAG